MWRGGDQDGLLVYWQAVGICDIQSLITGARDVDQMGSDGRHLIGDVSVQVTVVAPTCAI